MPVKRTPRAAEDNRFKPGERKVGRAKGVRNKFSRNVRDAALAAAARYGSNGKGKGGLVGFFFMMARDWPETFCKGLFRMIPKEIPAAVVAATEARPTFYSREELIQRLQARAS